MQNGHSTSGNAEWVLLISAEMLLWTGTSQEHGKPLLISSSHLLKSELFSVSNTLPPKLDQELLVLLTQLDACSITGDQTHGNSVQPLGCYLNTQESPRTQPSSPIWIPPISTSAPASTMSTESRVCSVLVLNPAQNSHLAQKPPPTKPLLEKQDQMKRKLKEKQLPDNQSLMPLDKK